MPPTRTTAAMTGRTTAQLRKAASAETTAAAAANATKGNDGSKAKRRRRNDLARTVVCSAFFLSAVWVVWETHFAPSLVPDVDYDSSTGNRRFRRRRNRHRKRFETEQRTTTLDAILEGHLTLVDLDIPRDALVGGPADRPNETMQYRGVQARFCLIDWKNQAKDPSSVPMFRDLRRKSPLCDATAVTVDLYDVTRQAQDYDLRYLDSITASGSPRSDAGIASERLISLRKPTGVVFHESRCGSTLAANLLVASQRTSSSSSSSSSRVYSESPMPLAALRACSTGVGCSEEKHVQLIRDTLYMMGRKKVAVKELQATETKPSDHRYYIKFQSVSSHYISAFTKALPDVPWLFLYREPVEVMQSYWKDLGGAGPRPKCALKQNMQLQPSVTSRVIREAQQDRLQLTPEGYCAAHFAGLAQSALDGYTSSSKTTNMGRFVEYTQLPQVMWESILPDHFHVPKSDIHVLNMDQVSKSYSKARVPQRARQWHDDSSEKRETASQRVIEAVDMFMKQRYRRMQELNNQRSIV